MPKQGSKKKATLKWKPGFVSARVFPQDPLLSYVQNLGCWYGDRLQHVEDLIAIDLIGDEIRERNHATNTVLHIDNRHAANVVFLH